MIIVFCWFQGNLNDYCYIQVAVVTVAFPATPLLLARARICISASHTREDLLKALEVSCCITWGACNFLML